MLAALTQNDIFDVCYDKLGKDNSIHSIEFGYGRIVPNCMEKSKRKIDYIGELL